MQILVNGVIQGLLTAVLTLGFAIVYNSTGILHIAQGAIFTLAPFVLLSAITSGMGILPAILLSIVIAILLSVLMERLNHWPLQKREASMPIHLITSLGIYIALIQVIVIIWGSDTKVLRQGIDTTYAFQEVILTQSQILGGGLSLAMILVFFYWLKKTDSGLKFIALADNPILLSLLGYDIAKLRLIVFGLSGLLTASAALLTAMDIGFDPYGGLAAVLLAIVATIIGGRGSFFGPVIAGLMLGILRSQAVWYTSARWQDAITFLLLVLFLFFRPQGIMGEKGRPESL